MCSHKIPKFVPGWHFESTLLFFQNGIYITNENSISTSKVSHGLFAPFWAKLGKEIIKIWFENTRNICKCIQNVNATLILFLNKCNHSNE